MEMPSDANRGWMSRVYRQNDSVLPNETWTNEPSQAGGHSAATSGSRKGLRLDLVSCPETKCDHIVSLYIQLMSY